MRYCSRFGGHADSLQRLPSYSGIPAQHWYVFIPGMYCTKVFASMLKRYSCRTPLEMQKPPPLLPWVVLSERYSLVNIGAARQRFALSVPDQDFPRTNPLPPPLPQALLFTERPRRLELLQPLRPNPSGKRTKALSLA